MTRLVVLDTETTGLEHAAGHRIIEIGCVEIINRQITTATYHQYINPGRAIDRGAQKVHGITREFLQDKPGFTTISDDFLNFIRGAELIIHNAPFDVGFINAEFSRLQAHPGRVDKLCTITDTLPLARRKHPGQKNNLDALCRRYEIDNSDRELHGALLDAKLLAKVYLAMTGGQGSLFSSSTNGTANGQQNRKLSDDFSHIELSALAASSAENHLHHLYLQDNMQLSDEDLTVWQLEREAK